MDSHVRILFLASLRLLLNSFELCSYNRNINSYYLSAQHHQSCFDLFYARASACHHGPLRQRQNHTFALHRRQAGCIFRQHFFEFPASQSTFSQEMCRICSSGRCDVEDAHCSRNCATQVMHRLPLSFYSLMLFQCTHTHGLPCHR